MVALDDSTIRRRTDSCLEMEAHLSLDSRTRKVECSIFL